MHTPLPNSPPLVHPSSTFASAPALSGSRDLDRCWSGQSDCSQGVHIFGILLCRQRCESNPRQSIRDGGLDLPLTCRLGRSVVDHIRLIDPADEQRTAAVGMWDFGRIKRKSDGSTSAGGLVVDLGGERSDEGDIWLCGAGIPNNEGVCKT